jgi:hypothetical protein
MTPEERFDKIEQILERLTNSQVRMDAAINKQYEGIQALIVVNRTCLESIKELRTTQERGFEELREMSKATDEKLNILIDTVDRIIRRDSGRKPGA